MGHGRFQLEKWPGILLSLAWIGALALDAPPVGPTTDLLPGRLTDRSADNKILKIQFENDNIRFLKKGDQLEFRIGDLPLRKKDSWCVGVVEQTEPFFVTLRSEDLSPCLSHEMNLRRGALAEFRSLNLQARIFEAKEYRELLLTKKNDLLEQLEKLNRFLWAFEQKKVQTAAQYDIQITELQDKKRLALDELLDQKKESVDLQMTLRQALVNLDKDLNHYEIQHQEYLLDRWNMDHDTGIPFDQRPGPYLAPENDHRGDRFGID